MARDTCCTSRRTQGSERTRCCGDRMLPLGLARGLQPDPGGRALSGPSTLPKSSSLRSLCALSALTLATKTKPHSRTERTCVCNPTRRFEFCGLSGRALDWHRQTARARVRPRRTTAHTTTSLSEQISLSFRLSPNRNTAAAESPPPVSSTTSGAAAQDSTKQPSEQAAGHAAALLAASNATSAI